MRPDGGPAFPQFLGPQVRDPELSVGMSMRDYFAAAAINGLVSREGDQRTNQRLAETAFAVADAMLAARK